MTMTRNPLIVDAEDLQRLPVPNAAIARMPGANPLLPVAAAPMLAAPAPIVAKSPEVQNTQLRTIRDQGELQRINDSGSGVSQIKNPFLRGLARIGDVAASVITPNAAAAIPGTTYHHNVLLNQQANRVNNDLGNEREQAQTEQENALTGYTQARPQIEQSKIDQRQTAIRDRVAQAAAARGQNVTWDEDGVPNFTDDHESQAFHDHQALSAMHEATASKSSIMADIQKNHYIPGTPEWTEAQKKLQQVDQRLKVAMGSLGLRAQGLELRRENQQANLYGTDMQGNALPGAPQLENDDGNMQTVGLRAGNLAVKQQGKVTSFNDLQGSAQHTREALDALHASGADLSDPKVVAAMSDPTSMVGKIVNGKLVRGSLSDAQVKAIGAINQLREQIGIMRSTTGGPAAEAQAQRMLSALPEAGDSKSTAINKLNELDGVITRLRPGAVHVAGGLKVAGQGSTGTVMMQAPDGSKRPVPSDQVDHYKKLGAKVVQ